MDDLEYDFYVITRQCFLRVVHAGIMDQHIDRILKREEFFRAAFYLLERLEINDYRPDFAVEFSLEFPFQRRRLERVAVQADQAGPFLGEQARRFESYAGMLPGRGPPFCLAGWRR